MAGNAPVNFNNSRTVHINQPLSRFSVGYHPTGMVAEQIFNVIPVAHESDDYVVWDKGQAFRVERTDGYGTLRADGSPSLLEDFGATLKNYRAEEFARKTRVTDRQRANQDDVFQLEVSKVRRVQDKILLDEELRVANILLTTANYPAANVTTLSGTSQWNNASFASQTSGTFSVIEMNFDAGREAIRLATGGKEANVAIIPAAVARVMKRDVGVRDSIKYTHGDILENGALPDVLWGLRVICPAAVYTTSAEGEVPTMTDVWGKNVIIAYVDPNAGLDSLTLGKIFRARPWQVKQWRDEEVESTYYEPSLVQAEQLISGDCGYLIQSAIA
ncbi:MAG TPA: hypothetical protein VKQ30_01175 [Ktedonobacterales bacterium]|nr:hypothetical protein [Ktedonobacterales bacterium]